MNTETKQQVEKWTFFRNGHPDYTFEVLDSSGNTICSGVKNRETVVRIANLPVLEAENQQLKDINRELVETLNRAKIHFNEEGPLYKKITELLDRARTAGERIEK